MTSDQCSPTILIQCKLHTIAEMSEDLPDLLARLALSLAADLDAATQSAVKCGGRTSAALVAIGSNPNISNEGLRRKIGISHSSTVRLVDRLTAAGLVERHSATDDGRMVALRMTLKGQIANDRIVKQRSSEMQWALSPQTNTERGILEVLILKVLAKGARPD
jgi:MarR family transcriptional regulator, negative regulator of the multidrug operon emrRAB